MNRAALAEMRLTLQELEQALKTIDWWQENPPPKAALASVQPFCVDTLTFTEWLQWVYIPKMLQFMEVYQALPVASGLLPIAEEAWKGCAESTDDLYRIVKKLDFLVLHFHQVH